MSIFDLDTKLATHLPPGISSSRDAFGLSFLDVFKSGFKGNARARLQRGDDNFSEFPDGLLLRNSIHYKPTLPGKDLQATLNELQSAKENLKNKVRYVVTFDGKFIAARDLSVGDAMFCALSDQTSTPSFTSVFSICTATPVTNWAVFVREKTSLSAPAESLACTELVVAINTKAIVK